MNENENNIENQKLYIDLIALSLISLENTPIIENQNIFLKELFIDEGFNLIKFDFYNDKPILNLINECKINLKNIKII